MSCDSLAPHRPSPSDPSPPLTYPRDNNIMYLGLERVSSLQKSCWYRMTPPARMVLPAEPYQPVLSRISGRMKPPLAQALGGTSSSYIIHTGRCHLPACSQPALSRASAPANTRNAVYRDQAGDDSKKLMACQHSVSRIYF